MMYKFTNEQLEAIAQFEEAKKVFKLIEKKYKKVVEAPFKKFAQDIVGLNTTWSADLPNGKKLVYQPPRKYWAKKSDITQEYLVALIPEAFVEKTGYESVKLIGKKNE